MNLEIDPLGFDEWVSDLDKVELLHAYRAIKILEIMNFQLVAMENEELIENVKEAISSWAKFK